MTRETKIGIAMVLVLVGVFGFLVYKRATRPGETLAQAETTEEVDSQLVDALDEPTSPRREFATGDADDDEEEEQIVPVVAKARPIPRDEPKDDLGDPFSDADSKPSSAKNSQPKLLVAMPDQEAEESRESVNGLESFGNEQPSDAEEESTPVMSSREPEVDGADPFSSDTTVAAEDEMADEPAIETPAFAEKSTPLLEFESPEASTEQSFGADEVDVVPAKPVPAKPVPVVASPKNAFESREDHSEEEISISARATIPDRNLDFGEEQVETEVERVFEPEMAAETAIEAESPPERLETPVASRPVPELMLDDSPAEDRYGDYEPIELADATDADPFGVASLRSDAPRKPEVKDHPSKITGNRHVVQSGESFWSISQKKYGTGRYFQALAAYNQKTVPDTAKMKPGIEIALPTSEELERRYPALVSPTGQTEPAAAAGAGQVRGEYLVSNGQPMYRIGTGDTLSDIAQRYLGRARRWEQILVMNRDVLKDGNSLKVGAMLRLPSDATQVQLSNQPREFR